MASRLALAWALGACGGSARATDAPEATLGDSPANETAVRRLVRRWMVARPEDRLALEPELRAMATHRRGDPLDRTLGVLRAWDALERGDRAGATRLASPALAGPPGTARDLATLVVGATERRAGRPRQALERLQPLLHKLLDPAATTLLDEELVRAAVAAREWVAALRFMDVWVSQSAPAERGRVLMAITSLLADFPPERLVDELRARVGRGAYVLPDERRLAEALTQHLASQALARQDVSLARLLLDDAGALLGPVGEDVARLAGDRARGRVAPHTVGVLLALGTPSLQRRSAEVVSGMAYGLRIGEGQSRLVSRDDGGRVDGVVRALTELAAEGAAVLVAGIDPRHVAPAAAFAASEKVALVLLSPGGADARSGPVFSVGERVERTVGALAGTLRESGAKVVAGVGLATSDDAGTAGEGVYGIGLALPCVPMPAPATLREERVDALVVLDGAHCGAEVFELARALRAPVALGLGALAGERIPDGVATLAAGLFPLPGPGEESPGALFGWNASGRPRPTWWMALGRDVAVLAEHAVRDLGDAASDDEVRDRRAQAVGALASAEAVLWTSDARGFDGGRILPRSVVVTRTNRRRDAR